MKALGCAKARRAEETRSGVLRRPKVSGGETRGRGVASQCRSAAGKSMECYAGGLRRLVEEVWVMIGSPAKDLPIQQEEDDASTRLKGVVARRSAGRGLACVRIVAGVRPTARRSAAAASPQKSSVRAPKLGVVLVEAEDCGVVRYLLDARMMPLAARRLNGGVGERGDA